MYSEKVHIMNHPLVAHKLTIMRDKHTSVKDFRELVSEIGMLITYEATRDLPLTTKHIETPICEMDAPTLAGRKFVVVPILRAGRFPSHRVRSGGTSPVWRRSPRGNNPARRRAGMPARRRHISGRGARYLPAPPENAGSPPFRSLRSCRPAARGAWAPAPGGSRAGSGWG